jgi:hypothetical protein
MNYKLFVKNIKIFWYYVLHGNIFCLYICITNYNVKNCTRLKKVL